jgi:hypothetical protein
MRHDPSPRPLTANPAESAGCGSDGKRDQERAYATGSAGAHPEAARRQGGAQGTAAACGPSPPLTSTSSSTFPAAALTSLLTTARTTLRKTSHTQRTAALGWSKVTSVSSARARSPAQPRHRRPPVRSAHPAPPHALYPFLPLLGRRRQRAAARPAVRRSPPGSYARTIGCAHPNVCGRDAYVAPSSSPVALSPRSVGRTLTPRWAPSAITDRAGGTVR